MREQDGGEYGPVQVADRVEVLRLGRRVARLAVGDATVERLVTAMTSGTAEAAAA